MTLEELLSLVTDFSEATSPTPEMKLSELGMDSLDFIELIMAVEDKLGIEIDDDGMDPNVSIREFHELIVELERDL